MIFFSLHVYLEDWGEYIGSVLGLPDKQEPKNQDTTDRLNIPHLGLSVPAVKPLLCQ